MSHLKQHNLVSSVDITKKYQNCVDAECKICVIRVVIEKLEKFIFLALPCRPIRLSRPVHTQRVRAYVMRACVHLCARPPAETPYELILERHKTLNASNRFAFKKYNLLFFLFVVIGMTQ